MACPPALQRSRCRDGALPCERRVRHVDIELPNKACDGRWAGSPAAQSREAEDPNPGATLLPVDRERRRAGAAVLSVASTANQPLPQFVTSYENRQNAVRVSQGLLVS
jgi:hypothetical protein